MILSNVEIQAALHGGRLKIEPQPAPPKPSHGGPECPYQTCAVDLRLDTEIVRWTGELPIAVDLRRGGFTNLAKNNMERFELTDEQPFELKPGGFVLARTLERVALPLPSGPDDPYYAARIEGRSSNARFGLLIHFTAPTIHAGYEGRITLEICNLGPYRIMLHKHEYVCQLIVERVRGEVFRNDSQFQGQTNADGRTA